MQQQPQRSIGRTKTRMRATIGCMSGETRGSVMDLSEQGMKLYMSNDLRAEPGYRVTVVTEEMGLLTGVVRWIKPPYLGIELNLSSNTRAKVESFYKYFADTRIRA